MEDVKIATRVFTISEYAKLSDSTYRRVKTLCESGILPAYRTKGGHWRILVRENFVLNESVNNISENT